MSGETIGILRPTRLTCGRRHLPGCYNPWTNQTYCICGKKRWAGDVGTWHNRRTVHPRRRPNDGQLVGYDTYFLHAAECPERERPGRQSHICEATP